VLTHSGRRPPPLGKDIGGSQAQRCREVGDRKLDLAMRRRLRCQRPQVAARLDGIRVPATGRHAQTFRELQDLLPPAARRYAVEFDRARRKRHALMYDQVGMVGDGKAADLLAAVAEFRELLLDEAARRLSQHRPEG